MKVCGVLAPVPAGHRWFDLLSERQDTAEELHDLLVALAAIRDSGAEVTLVAGRRSALDMLRETSEFRPDLVVLAASSARWPSAMTLAPRLTRVTQAPIILFGRHARRFPEHALETAKGADQAVVAGIDALVEAVNRVRLGQPAKGVAGVWDRFAPAAPRRRYDGPLPAPAWDLLRGHRPLDGVASAVGVRLGPLPGPYGGAPYSPEAASRSLERAARLRPKAGSIALDTSIVADPAWFDRLTKCLSQHGPPLSWSCRLPPGAVTPKVARQLGSAGCGTVTLTLGALGGRGTDGFPARVASAARSLRLANVGVGCDLVLGAPDASQRSDREAVRIAHRHAPASGVVPRLFRPEPGGSEWEADQWTPTRYVEGQLQPARAMYWPRGYGSLGEVEAEWRLGWLKGAVDVPSRVVGPLWAVLRRLPAAPAR